MENVCWTSYVHRACFCTVTLCNNAIWVDVVIAVHHVLIKSCIIDWGYWGSQCAERFGQCHDHTVVFLLATAATLGSSCVHIMTLLLVTAMYKMTTVCIYMERHLSKMSAISKPQTTITKFVGSRQSLGNSSSNSPATLVPIGSNTSTQAKSIRLEWTVNISFAVSLAGNFMQILILPPFLTLSKTELHLVMPPVYTSLHRLFSICRRYCWCCCCFVEQVFPLQCKSDTKFTSWQPTPLCSVRVFMFHHHYNCGAFRTWIDDELCRCHARLDSFVRIPQNENCQHVCVTKSE